MLAFVIYIFLGVILDYLIVLYYRSISARLALPASALAIIITGLTLEVIEKVIKSDKPFLLLAYSLGTGLGTFIGMNHKK